MSSRTYLVMRKGVEKYSVKGDFVRIFGALIFVLCSHFVQAIDKVPGCQSSICECAASPNVHCGMTPTATFDKKGRLWVAFLYKDHVYLSHSEDSGKSFSTPIKVNPIAEKIYSNGENRPKVAFGVHGEIYISWIRKTGQNFSGDVRFSRSLDGGRHFEKVRTINDDGLVTSHRFESMLVDSPGSIYLVWIDKRDLVAAKSSGQPYTGAAIYYAVSTDNGGSFTKNRKVADYSCQCCRIAISESRQGAAIFWRHIFGENTRDHAFAELGKDGLIKAKEKGVQRVTWDDWKINACPHHGPAMTNATLDTAGNRNHHLTWFTGGESNHGIYYGKYFPEESRLVNIRAMTNSPTASHPHIQMVGKILWLAWKEFDGQHTKVQLAVSENSGENWQPTKTIATTDSASDHPFLLKSPEAMFLSWHTKAEGLRIIPLQEHSRGEVKL